MISKLFTFFERGEGLRCRSRLLSFQIRSNTDKSGWMVLRYVFPRPYILTHKQWALTTPNLSLYIQLNHNAISLFMHTIFTVNLNSRFHSHLHSLHFSFCSKMSKRWGPLQSCRQVRYWRWRGSEWDPCTSWEASWKWMGFPFFFLSAFFFYNRGIRDSLRVSRLISRHNCLTFFHVFLSLIHFLWFFYDLGVRVSLRATWFFFLIIVWKCAFPLHCFNNQTSFFFITKVSTKTYTHHE